MAATNYTPISLYYSSTATNTPSAGNLVYGELAINIADGKLYYKNPSNVVTLLASTAGVVPSPFTSGGVVYASSSSVLATGAALTFDGTNLGLGVTPSAWGSLIALDISSYGSVFGFSNQAGLTGNCYYNGSSWVYKATAAATQYQQISGQHIWYNAASGSGTFNFTQAMTLDASGNLLVGTTATTGSSSNTAKIVGGVFSTASGTISTTSGVAVTIFAAPNLVNGTYIVSVGLNAASPVNYNAVSIVSVDNTVLRITNLQVANLNAISISGQNIQVTQTSGGAQTVYYTVTRLS